MYFFSLFFKHTVSSPKPVKNATYVTEFISGIDLGEEVNHIVNIYVYFA